MKSPSHQVTLTSTLQHNFPPPPSFLIAHPLISTLPQRLHLLQSISPSKHLHHGNSLAGQADGSYTSSCPIDECSPPSCRHISQRHFHPEISHSISCHSPRCPASTTKEDSVWRTEGSGSDIPESVRSSRDRPQIGPEVWRLVQNQGDSAQGPRLDHLRDQSIRTAWSRRCRIPCRYEVVVYESQGMGEGQRPSVSGGQCR